MSQFDGLVFVDCEAVGLGCPSRGQLTEFGAVHYSSRRTHLGVVVADRRDWWREVGKWPLPDALMADAREHEAAAFEAFERWLGNLPANGKRLTFVSDNPAFDWQWINDGFLRLCGANPFGFSARRIGDYYAGLMGDYSASSRWKSLRRTKHDHNPVNDAMGNVEAFERMTRGAK